MARASVALLRAVIGAQAQGVGRQANRNALPLCRYPKPFSDRDSAGSASDERSVDDGNEGKTTLELMLR